MTLTVGSVCSGIGAPELAWQGLGWRFAWCAEIEKFPAAVFATHFDSLNYGDMTQFKDWPDDPAIDVLVGGTPCQSFSVAGLRAGLADPRGNLALTYLAIAARYWPNWLVWENVPGVLSSGEGRDFGAFLGGLEKLGYGWAYRTLDAQNFGVPQRRRRVFVVGHLGNWRRAAAVLFERESLSGDIAPRREAGQRVADSLTVGANQCSGFPGDITHDVAPSLVNSGRGVERTGESRGQDPVIAVQTVGGVAPTIPKTANPLTARMHKGVNTTADEGQTMITHALRGEGFDASEDGTGRGVPLFAFHNRQDPDTGEVTHPLGAMDRGLGVVFDTTQTAMAIQERATSENPENGPDGKGYRNDDTAYTLEARQVPQSVAHRYAVRRLTPRECERLQGFPDDYTQIAWRGKPPELCPDGPRYKALGNSMAVPVMRWIGERIAMVERL